MRVSLVYWPVLVLAFVETASFAQPQTPAELTEVAYQVADLVIPFTSNGSADKLPTQENPLMDRIRMKVAAVSWEGGGGPGKMRYEPAGYVLRVRQTSAIHVELKSFLESLRRGQVAVEVRLLTVPDSMLEKLVKDGLAWSQSDGLRHVLFDDLKLQRLLDAARSEESTSNLRMPKVTMFDGQDAKLEVLDSVTFKTGADAVMKDGKPVVIPKEEAFSVGVAARLLPAISADRKRVSLQGEVSIRKLLGNPAMVTMSVPVRSEGSEKPVPMRFIDALVERPAFTECKLAVAAKIPDQRTLAVVAGKTLLDANPPERYPVLSRIPYANRLFRNTAFGRETATILVLFTPRIIGEPETVEVERLRKGFHAEDDGLFPRMVSKGAE